MPKRLREARIRQTPLEVYRYPGFKNFVRPRQFQAVEQDLLALIRAIENGIPLSEDFYRQGVDSNDPPDILLADHGIMHLHLGGSHSDVLVFLVQYDDGVPILEINDHKHFKTDPPGTYLRQLHETMLKRREAEIDGTREHKRLEKEAALEAKRAAVQAGLRGKRRS